MLWNSLRHDLSEDTIYRIVLRALFGAFTGYILVKLLIPLFIASTHSSHYSWFIIFLFSVTYALSQVHRHPFFWKIFDEKLVDGAMVNGSAWLVQKISGGLKRLQTGYVQHYALSILIGLVLILYLIMKR